MKSVFRISALGLAAIIADYALFVMQDYLTGVWGLGITHAAAILNIWEGISLLLALFFLCLVAALLGDFKMLVFSSIAYSVGIGFVAMSLPPVLARYTGTCKEYEPHCIGRTHKDLFYTGMQLIALGKAGYAVSMDPFFEQQGSTFKEIWRPRFCLCLRFACYFAVAITVRLAAFALQFVTSWSLSFGIPAICSAVGTILFLSGSKRYKKAQPQGSPGTNVCRVFVASVYKRSQPFPQDAQQLYKSDDPALNSYPRTRFLRFLERAAIRLPGEDQAENTNSWRLCSVAEVEEAKFVIRLIPIFLTFITCGIVSSIGNTFFIEQANNMDRHIGVLKVPIQVFLLLTAGADKLFSMLARCLMKFRKLTRCTAPIGIAVAMAFSVLCCITAAKTEQRRLNVMREQRPTMGIYWLLFQFWLLAGLDSFLEPSVEAFFDDQCPESMRQFLKQIAKGVLGLGYICNVLLVSVVSKVRPTWFHHTLNESRLDLYYWVLAALSAANLFVFILLLSTCRYMNLQLQAKESPDGADSH